MRYKFEELENAPLVIDAIYEGGNNGNTGDDPLCKLLPKTSNMGGFRKTKRDDDSQLPAYVVIYTTAEEIEWPDFFDAETGIFRCYGDNRYPGYDLHDTPKKGNSLLRDVFLWLNSSESIKNIPPFLIFQKIGHRRDVRFLGLAAPGNPNIPPAKDLNAFWKTIGSERFQNYEAYFTILDTQNSKIKKEWLIELMRNHKNSLGLAPKVWKRFIEQGRSGIRALKAPRASVIRTKFEQLDLLESEEKLLECVFNRYKENPYGFEKCATVLIQMMDSNFSDFILTRPWRDGGRDATAKYKIGLENQKLTIDCAIEAKCYSKNNGVGVKEMSRLISRLKYRQFGVLVTTSYVSLQAYREIIEDGHPILIICAKDIAKILRRNSFYLDMLPAWLNSIETSEEEDLV